MIISASFYFLSTVFPSLLLIGCSENLLSKGTMSIALHFYLLDLEDALKSSKFEALISAIQSVQVRSADFTSGLAINLAEQHLTRISSNFNSRIILKYSVFHSKNHQLGNTKNENGFQKGCKDRKQFRKEFVIRKRGFSQYISAICYLNERSTSHLETEEKLLLRIIAVSQSAFRPIDHCYRQL